MSNKENYMYGRQANYGIVTNKPLEREPYWDYMGRRLREEWNKETWSMDDMYKKEVSEMQSSIHVLQMRIKTLSEQVLELNTKVEILGGDPRQLEFRF